MNKVTWLLRKIPFLKITLSFSLGIIANEFIQAGNLQLLLPILVLVAAMLYAIIPQHSQVRKKRVFKGLLAYLVIMLISWLYTFQYQHDNSKPLKINNADVFRLKAVSASEKGSYYNRFEAMLYNHDTGVLRQLKCMVILKNKDSVNVQPGDYIYAKASVTKPKNYGNPNEFNYRKYLERKNIHNILYVDSGDWVIHDSAMHHPLRLAHKSRTAIASRLQSPLLNSGETGLLRALLLGERNALAPDTRTLFQSSGIAHLLAVSGMHVGMIYVVFQWIISLCARHHSVLKQLLNIVAVCAIWGYAFITGLSVSVTRAAIMFSLFVIAHLTQRKPHPVNSLSVAACIILIINPNQLFMVGFQLSFLAVLGIVIIYPLLNQLFIIRLKWLRLVWQITAVSISAQVLTMPLVLYYFHSYSLASVIINLVAIPAAMIFLYGAIMLAVFAHVEIIYTTVSFIIKTAFHGFINILTYTTNIHWVFHDRYLISIPGILFAYLLIFIILLLIQSPRKHFIYAALFTITAMLTNTSIQNWKLTRKHELVIFNARGETVITYLKNRQLSVFYSGDNEYKHLSSKYLLPYCIKNRIGALKITNATDTINNPVFQQYKHSVFFSYQKDNWLVLNDPLKLKDTFTIHHVIISRKTPYAAMQTIKKIFPERVIIDSSVPGYSLNKWTGMLTEAGIKYISITHHGALKV